MSKPAGNLLYKTFEPSAITLTGSGAAEVFEHLDYRSITFTVDDATLASVLVHATASAQRGNVGVIYPRLDGAFLSRTVQAGNSEPVPASLNEQFALWLTDGAHTLDFVYEGPGDGEVVLTDFTVVIVGY